MPADFSPLNSAPPIEQPVACDARDETSTVEDRQNLAVTSAAAHIPAALSGLEDQIRPRRFIGELRSGLADTRIAYPGGGYNPESLTGVDAPSSPLMDRSGRHLQAWQIAFASGEQNDPERPRENFLKRFLAGDARGKSPEPPITRYAKPIVPGKKLPGSPAYAGGSRYLLTGDLSYGDLGYSTTIRETYIENPVLPARLDEITILTPSRIAETNINLLSAGGSGTEGTVKLAFLDGQPVALKSYQTPTERQTERRVLEEARSASFYDQLGVGFVFHGLYPDRTGALNIVMQVAPGDFYDAYSGDYNPRINAQTFADLESILNRLKGAGVHHLSLIDLQMLLSDEHRLAVIDAGDVSNYIGVNYAGSPYFATDEFAEERSRFLAHANTEVGVRYLERLRVDDPAAWQGVVEYFRTRPKDLLGDNGQIYKRYHSSYKTYIDTF